MGRREKVKDTECILLLKIFLSDMKIIQLHSLAGLLTNNLSWKEIK